MLPGDLPQITSSQCDSRLSSISSNPNEANILHYAEIKDDNINKNLDLESPNSRNLFASSISKTEQTAQILSSYTKLKAIVPSTYTSLNQTDADLHNSRNYLNTKRWIWISSYQKQPSVYKYFHFESWCIIPDKKVDNKRKVCWFKGK